MFDLADKLEFRSAISDIQSKIKNIHNKLETINNPTVNISEVTKQLNNIESKLKDIERRPSNKNEIEIIRNYVEDIQSMLVTTVCPSVTHNTLLDISPLFNGINNSINTTNQKLCELNTNISVLSDILVKLDSILLAVTSLQNPSELIHPNIILNFPANGLATVTEGNATIDFYNGTVSGTTSGNVTGSFYDIGITSAKSFTLYTNKQVDIQIIGIGGTLLTTVIPGTYRVPATDLQKVKINATETTNIWIAASNLIDGSPENVVITKNVIKKTYNNNIISIQKVTTAPRVVISNIIDVSTSSQALLFIRLGRQVETAFTASVNIRIEASSRSSGDYWYTITTFSSALGSSVGSEVITSATSGQKNLSVASTTGFAQRDIVYIDNITISSSEWHRVTGITTNTTISLEENIVNLQTGSTVYDQAEQYFAQIDCSTFERLRVVVDGSGAAQNFVIQADTILSEDNSSIV